MSFQNPEKEFVRNNIWLPAYRRFPGKTLTLPGVECKFERVLVQNGLRLEDIVAVERDLWLVEPIARFLAGRGRLYVGELSTLLAEGNLDDEFGFKVLNLDFCGSPYQLNAKRESKLLSTVSLAIRKQWEANVTEFALLLTGSTVFKAPPSVQAAHGRVDTILDHDVFEGLASVIGDNTIKRYFDSFDDANRSTAYALQATAMHVVDMGHTFQYRVEPICAPVVYQGQGHTARMLALGFAFRTYEQQGLRLNMTNDVVRNDMLRSMWDTTEQAVWLIHSHDD